MSKEHDRYTVGRGKPPKHTQFRPGVSGNPKGRPPRSHDVMTQVQEMLRQSVRLSGDRPRYISTIDAVLYQLARLALSGNVRAMLEIVKLAVKFGESPDNRLRVIVLDGSDSKL